MENLKEKGSLNIPMKSDKKEKEGILSFNYETKNVVEEKPVKEVTPKKQNSPLKKDI